MAVTPVAFIAIVLYVALHVVLFPVVAALPGPSWAKAAGYGWLVVDIALNIAVLNGFSLAAATSIRLGIHVSAAIWIALAAAAQGTRALKAVGWAAAGAFGGYSFVAPWVPSVAIIPGGVLLIAWLVLSGVYLLRHAPGVGPSARLPAT